MKSELLDLSATWLTAFHERRSKIAQLKVPWLSVDPTVQTIWEVPKTNNKRISVREGVI